MAPMYPLPLFPFLFSLFFFALFAAAPLPPDGNLSGCNESFSCGTITNIEFPFTGGRRPHYCGLPGFNLTCLDNSITLLTINSLAYRVLHIDGSRPTMTLARSDLHDTAGCTRNVQNTTLAGSNFTAAANTETLTLFYNCNYTSSRYGGYNPPNLFTCELGGEGENGFYMVGEVPEVSDMLRSRCNTSFTVPISDAYSGVMANGSLLSPALRAGFDVNYNDSYWDDCFHCYEEKHGACGFDADSGNSICICGNRRCPEGKSNKTAVAIGASAGAVAVLAGIGVCFLLLARQRRRKAAQIMSKDSSTPPSSATKGRTTPTTNYSITTSSYNTTTTGSDTLRAGGSTYFGVQVFSFDELEEATENFDRSKELGDGGFGTVYYGLLFDGRAVAVKRLYENNMRRAEQFMNEIEILAKLRHKNLVTLYGCTSRHSKELLLVYEYISNGTVADHLHGNRRSHDANSDISTWRVRMNIAIETADALAFLHASDVIHRDVKTNNILLDDNFHVKVADFGLSRLFPMHVTHVSTAPQGTPGYVDPEYYQCYQLTDKSDVYSFGVVLMELITSLQAVDTCRHRHDINLANMAVSKIQNQQLGEMVDPCIGFDKNYAVRRMVTSVAALAFRCLQQERDMRPSMNEVLGTLRRIERENDGSQEAEVVDIAADDDVGLLQHVPPPVLSPDSVGNDKWQKVMRTV